MSSVLLERVEDIEQRFRGLERELGEVRALLTAAPVPPVVEHEGSVVEPEAPAFEAPTFEPNPQSAPPGWVPPPWPPRLKQAPAPVSVSVSMGVAPPPVAPPPVPARPSRTMGELFEQWDL